MDEEEFVSLCRPNSVIVFDLDGTIANLDHRLHHVRSDKPNWNEFYRQADNDSSHGWAVELMRSLSELYTVIIVSARPETYRRETEEWLKKHGVEYSRMFMVRSDRNYSGDAELKRNWLKRFGKEKILFVVDDRQRVVDMWRSEGLVCLQCAAWEEYKNAEGKEKKNGQT
jgi:phosphoglycolate phosphatase-like HAD superfamily hydrolase